MRIIQLGFQLHAPREEADFAQANEEIYQPFLALLERNAQKYGQRLKISLVITGPWLDMAERKDKQLVERLQKLVRGGTLELIATTQFHSLANFYDLEEATTQVKQYQACIEREFGKKSRLLALPELVYNDKIGKWAEDIGFAGMLVGGGQRALDWRSPNHVYEAAGCKYLRLLFQNLRLSQMVARAEVKILAEKKQDDDSKKLMLSAKKFQKVLDLDCLRGNLVNLYFDAGVIAERRQDGIIGFFDELFESWLAVSGNRLVGAMEACVVETPSAEVSVKDAVSWRDKLKVITGETVVEDEPRKFGLVLRDEVEVRPPVWLNSSLQREVAREIYGLRKEILASEDEKLIEEFRRLTAVEVIDGLDEAQKHEIEEQIEDLHKRANEVKKTQAVEISRAYTKKRDRGAAIKVGREQSADGEVEVNIGAKRSGGVSSGAMHSVKIVETGTEDVPVRRLPNVEKRPLERGVKVETGRTDVDAQEVSQDANVDEEKPRMKKIRKIIKKLVIE